MNLLRQLAQELMQIATSPKVATGVVAGTTSSGVGTWLDWIPNDIGKLASLVGIILSVVLILVHVTMYKKARIELDILREQREKSASDSLD